MGENPTTKPGEIPTPRSSMGTHELEKKLAIPQVNLNRNKFFIPFMYIDYNGGDTPFKDPT